MGYLREGGGTGLSARRQRARASQQGERKVLRLAGGQQAAPHGGVCLGEGERGGPLHSGPALGST